jgi:uncharacterized damage-inducible protein DinB
MPTSAPSVGSEGQGLLAFLEQQRQAVRNATYGLREDQARLTPTRSGLSLGGLVKHLTYGEAGWIDRIQQESTGPLDDSPEALREYMSSFSLGEDETLAGALERYRDTARRTDAVIGGVDDLGREVPLPAAAWFPDGCTVRWVVLHLIEETARHAGHADIIREALDGGLSGPLMAAAEGWPGNGWIKPWQPQS